MFKGNRIYKIGNSFTTTGSTAIIYAGVPAKVFKYRNIEHFQKLKAEGNILDKLSD